MTYPDAQNPAESRRILWNQFILARALARIARQRCDPEEAEDEAPAFHYTDTHAGSGRLPGPLSQTAALMECRKEFSSPLFFDALRPALPDEAHPGSWILAGRVVSNLGFAAEIDVNDIDLEAIRFGQTYRESAWTHFGPMTGSSFYGPGWGWASFPISSSSIRRPTISAARPMPRMPPSCSIP